MNYRSYDDLNRCILANIDVLRTETYDLIVGIPRSGMLPASIISLELNVDLTDLGGLINNATLKRGNTRKKSLKLKNAWDAKKILLVDDSVLSGKSIKQALNDIPHDIKRKLKVLCVYSDNWKKENIDFILEKIPEPRLFQWNIFHRDILKLSCVDIDGVLCEDPLPWQNDDGHHYEQFLKHAKPKYIPSEVIHSLVTNRLEKYRSETEKWLKKYNIKYKNLVMLNLASKSDRLEQIDYVGHKRNYYALNDDCLLFIESDIKQAVEISVNTSKPVFCTDANTLISPNFINALSKSNAYRNYRIKYLIKKLIPGIILRWILKLKYRKGRV